MKKDLREVGQLGIVGPMHGFSPYIDVEVNEFIPENFIEIYFGYNFT